MDYDASVITTEQIFLELRTAGLDVESAVRIGVDGMHCRSCVQSIEGRIASLSGVLKVQVSLEDAAALIVHRPLLVTRQELRDHIQDLGFEATLLADDPLGPDLFWRSSVSTQTVTVWIVGMTCHSCVQSIEGRVSQMRGVQTVMVSLKEERGTVTFDPSLTAPEQLRAAIEDMGFDASLEGESLSGWSARAQSFYFEGADNQWILLINLEHNGQIDNEMLCSGAFSHFERHSSEQQLLFTSLSVLVRTGLHWLLWRRSPVRRGGLSSPWIE